MQFTLLPFRRARCCWTCLVLWFVQSFCFRISAFHAIPSVTTTRLARRQQQHLSPLNAQPLATGVFDASSTLILADDAPDIPMDQAFQDSVDVFDLSGPLGAILLATVGAMAILVLLKSLTGQMDAAIEKVLIDFESTLKENYPQRWRVVEAELEQVTDEERPAKLVSIMEKMQEEEPKFMSQVKEKMTNWKS